MEKTPIIKKNLGVRLSMLALALLLTFSFTACGDSGKPTGDYVLKVGDNNYVSQSQLDEYTLFMVNLLALSQGLEYDTFVTDEIIETAKPNILDLMAQTEALKIYFVDNKDILSPDTIDPQISDFKEQIFSYPGTEDRFKTLGITDDSVRYYVETSQLHQTLTDETSENGALPTEEEVNTFYSEHLTDFQAPEQRRASQVLFADEEHKPETKALAESVLEKLKKGEVKFEDMAAQYNTDDTKDTGGDLGLASREQYVTEFSDALFSMVDIDSLSDVIETTYGYHIIKLTEIQEPSVQTLDEVYQEIADYLAYELEMETATEITRNTKVEYLSDKYPEPDKRPQTSTGENEIQDEIQDAIQNAEQ
ncbi:peptidylprolyl isomerase [Clostridia bacterium]|nr:peptidylprolyl isomerase [Clostridia bacterium]